MTSQVEHDQNTHHAPISPEDEARRRKNWQFVCNSSGFEGYDMGSAADNWMEGYFKGQRSLQETIVGLRRIGRGQSPT